MLEGFMRGLTRPVTGCCVASLRGAPPLAAQACQPLRECLGLLRSQLRQLSVADRASREVYWSLVSPCLDKTVNEILPLYIATNPTMVAEIITVVVWSVAVVGGGSGATNACVAQVGDWVEVIVFQVTRCHYLADCNGSQRERVVSQLLQLLSLVAR